ncbi:MAG: efflux RND transporter periplasmic adaptor subunit [Alphaproteobacteria bacterium]|nr:efflux RND transporter periplasmic adaptor subunit [Alphaproteobacteria bacterium]
MQQRKSGKKFLYLLILLIIVSGSYFLFRKTDENFTYITEDVIKTNIQQVVNATGEVRAVDLVTVGAQASGKIEKLYVAIGQEVKTGDLIAQIDSTTQQNEVDTIKAKLNSYEAQLVAADVAYKVAEQKHQRLQKLYTQNATSKEDLETAQETFAEAKSRITQIISSLKEARISLSTAKTNLGYTKITSPLDGTIVSLPVKQGQTVNAAMNTPTIVQIANLDEMEIVIEISEGDILNIKPNDKVTYAILANLDKVYETTLKSIDPGLTSLSNGEYSEVVSSSEAIYYYGRLIVPNKNRDLRIGMTTQNVIYVDAAEDVLTLSTTAIKSKDGKKFVEILKADGKTKEQPIVTGVSDGFTVEIKEGLKEGQKVVVAQLSSEQISEKATVKRGPRGF